MVGRGGRLSGKLEPIDVRYASLSTFNSADIWREICYTRLKGFLSSLLFSPLFLSLPSPPHPFPSLPVSLSLTPPPSFTGSDALLLNIRKVIGPWRKRWKSNILNCKKGNQKPCPWGLPN